MNAKLFHLAGLTSVAVFSLGVMNCTTTAVGQGTVQFYNHFPGYLVTHVYAGGNQQLAGNGANDYPVGTRDWTGFVALNGSGYTAQLWAAPGLNQPESSLQPALQTTTFLTIAAGAGILVDAGDVSLPGVPVSSSATVTLRVWDNRGGTITSWPMAEAAGVALGEAPLFNTPSAGGPPTPAPYLIGLVSFNIYQVPEPSVLAFAGLGALALWAFRHPR